MKKMSGVNSETAIICEWHQREHVLTFFRTKVASGVALQESSDLFFGTFVSIYWDNNLFFDKVDRVISDKLLQAATLQ